MSLRWGLGLSAPKRSGSVIGSDEETAMPSGINRRQFLTFAASSAAMAGLSCRHANSARGRRASARFFFTSQGKTALMNADGTGLRYFNFDVPNQATWQPGPFLYDGRRVTVLSMMSRADGPGRPFL